MSMEEGRENGRVLDLLTPRIKQYVSIGEMGITAKLVGIDIEFLGDTL